MDSNHFQHHLKRCQQWAETYSKTGSYKPVDLSALTSLKSNGQNEKSCEPCDSEKSSVSSLATEFLASKKAKSEISSPIRVELSHESSQSTSQSKEKSSNETSVYQPIRMDNTAHKERHSLVSRLRKELKNFKNSIFQEYTENGLDSKEIEKEIANAFFNDKLMLNNGFLELENILSFANKRPYFERRLIKIAMLPEIPSMDDIKVFGRLLHTTEETILDWCDQRSRNDPRYSRSDKGQTRMSVDHQMELMNYIYQNSHYLPKKDGIKTIAVEKISNLASKMFLK